MRLLIDQYIRAEDSETIADFGDLGLIDLIVNNGTSALDKLPKGLRENKDTMAETIENNVRKVIIDKSAINPKFYDRMSELLDALIEERRQHVDEYEDYLRKIKELCGQVQTGSTSNKSSYPVSINTQAKQSLYDELDSNEELTNRIHDVILSNKKADWIGQRIKERELTGKVKAELGDKIEQIDDLMELIKNQYEYQ